MSSFNIRKVSELFVNFFLVFIHFFVSSGQNFDVNCFLVMPSNWHFVSRSDSRPIFFWRLALFKFVSKNSALLCCVVSVSLNLSLKRITISFSKFLATFNMELPFKGLIGFLAESPEIRKRFNSFFSIVR